MLRAPVNSSSSSEAPALQSLQKWGSLHCTPPRTAGFSVPTPPEDLMLACLIELAGTCPADERDENQACGQTHRPEIVGIKGLRKGR